MKRTISVRLAATGAAAALAFTGLGIGAAFADITDGGNGPADASSIDTKAPKSLTIHKFTPSSVIADNDGRELAENGKVLTEAGAKPIDGIKFKIRKIKNIDMLTNEGWKQAEKVADKFKENKTEATITSLSVCGNDGTTACALGDPVEKKTGEVDAVHGIAQFTGLEPGYYLVEEDLDGSVKGEVKVDGAPEIEKDMLVASDPFLVAVPLTNPQSKTEWLYNVHVYPKNSPVSIEKEVWDQNTPGAGNSARGSEITYTVKTDIPARIEKLNNYTVIDPLSKGLTYLDTGKVYVAKAGSDDKIDTVTLTEGVAEDYEVISTPVTWEDFSTVLTLRFTETGRAKLITARDNNAAARVIWKLNANINEIVDNRYDIPNEAVLYPVHRPDNAWKPSAPTEDIPGTRSGIIYSKYGQVHVTKTGLGDAPLTGAKFQLFLCNADGQILDYKNDSHPAKDKKQPGETNSAFLARVAPYKISVNNKTEWTSGVDGDAPDDGMIIIDGLQLNNWQNDKSTAGVDGGFLNPDDGDYYCLVETQAPAKYELLPEPIKFQLTTFDSFAGGTIYRVEFPVKNVPDNGGFKLPITGGQGIALLVTAGGLLVAGSVAYTVAASRKRKQQA